MNRNGPKLHADDSRAIDLLLNHGAAAAHGSARGGVTAATVAVSPRRLASARRVLALLSAIPETDVPANLAARTVSRIDSATGGVLNPAARASAHQPHA